MELTTARYTFWAMRTVVLASWQTTSACAHEPLAGRSGSGPPGASAGELAIGGGEEPAEVDAFLRIGVLRTMALVSCMMGKGKYL